MRSLGRVCHCHAVAKACTNLSDDASAMSPGWGHPRSKERHLYDENTSLVVLSATESPCSSSFAARCICESIRAGGCWLHYGMHDGFFIICSSVVNGVAFRIWMWLWTTRA
jgi:hypothetical protein